MQPEIPPEPVRVRRRRTRPRQEDLQAVVEEIRRQGILTRRYLFLIGAAIAVLLLLQLGIVKVILEYVIITAVILAVLLTAPLWSRWVVLITDRIPWLSRRRTPDDLA